MGKTCFRPQIGDRFWKLEVSGYCKELKEECIDRAVGQFAPVLLFEAVEDRLLALRSVDRSTGSILELAHLMYQFHTLVKERKQGIVNAVYLLSELIQSHTLTLYRCRYSFSSAIWSS